MRNFIAIPMVLVGFCFDVGKVEFLGGSLHFFVPEQMDKVEKSKMAKKAKFL